eukprot:CAMPEP_0182925528 /NCGR_PEP_ID=MMETSP0105_2-20130417/9458_1 /TAXON_ID=81532 ORGANISM="Acanthoeca-like sp., Strain 10tr" /NCGR_SAMPLE_ID=MMETSP0105_2 /ASSEMBLY_ACC=CAM_ASM_000205 /LENGTH=477 /DNA_ID=CAMNT_0025063381 /DNA_START=86 /DNA_END=1519 /DNA_ORIENTATION=+
MVPASKPRRVRDGIRAACASHTRRAAALVEPPTLDTVETALCMVTQDTALCSIDALPDEVVTIILGLAGSRWALTTVHQVCRKWRRICRNVPVIIWPRPQTEPGRASWRSWLHLPSNCALYRTDDRSLVCQWLVDVASRFRLLRFPEHVLRGHRFCPSEVMQSTIAATRILKASRHLSKLIVPEGFSTSVLDAIPECCPRLRSLDILCGGRLEQPLTKIFSTCRQLEMVTISGSYDPNHGVSDLSLFALAGSKGPSRLTVVNFVGMPRVTDAGLEAVAKACPLVDVSLVDMAMVTDVALMAIAEHCPELRRVHLSGDGTSLQYTDNGVVALATHCHDLIDVDVQEAPSVSDVALVAVAKNCPNLMFVGMAASTVTDTGVEALVRRCKTLRHADLRDCAITDLSVRLLLAHHPVELLYLGGCGGLRTASVDHIILHGTELSFLDADMFNIDISNIPPVALGRLRLHCLHTAIEIEEMP